MNWATISSILSTMGQLSPAAIVTVICVLSGTGIGIGIAFRDIPKYIYKTVVAILNFILILIGKEQIDVSPKQNEEKNHDKTKIFTIIEGGKSEKKKSRHEDGHVT